MANVGELKATARSPKANPRAIRRTGQVPGIIYGDAKDPLPIAVDNAELRQRIYAGHFLTTIYEIDVDGTKHRVIPRDFQLDPIRDFPIHVDFMRLGEGATIRVHIPIHVMNTDAAPGVKRGGAVNIVTHAIEVRCPADSIPNSIDVDLTGLEMNHSIHLSSITLPPDVRPLVSGDITLVTIVPPSGFIEEQKAAAAAAVAAATAAAAAPEATPGAAPAGGGGAAPGAAPAGGAAPKS
jgi:large subunit ribosomal protein L25